MGKPKFSKKKYETPNHPWKEARIKAENELVAKYGLKNKREIWKAETALRNYRGQARGLLAKIGSDDTQTKKELQSSVVKDDIKAKIVREDWNSYKLENGMVVQIRNVLVNVSRTSKFDSKGIPIYLVDTNVIVKVPREEIERIKKKRRKKKPRSKK